MSDITNPVNKPETQREFGKYSWIKPALVFGAIGVSIYGVMINAPYLIQMIEEVFMFLIFFDLLG